MVGRRGLSVYTFYNWSRLVNKESLKIGCHDMQEWGGIYELSNIRYSLISFFGHTEVL